jgi:DNA-binding phage protein
MPYRTESFDKFLSEQLQEPGMAKGFLLSSLEGKDGFTLIEAIIRTINCMGIKEFSEMSGIHRNAVSRMMVQNDIPKIETLNKYLAAFDLKAKILVEPMDAA